MRLFCPECGKQLVIKHSIEVALMSNFTHCDGVITLTKHQIRNSENIRQKISLEKTDGMFCMNCNKTYSDIENACCQCDECNSKILVKNIQPIGETIILCDGCLAKYKHFKDFKIFGLRGPDRKTRKKRFTEVISEVNATRDLPDEIQQIYANELDGNNGEGPFEVPEEIIGEINNPSIVMPPEEQISPQERARRNSSRGFRSVDADISWTNNTYRWTPTDNSTRGE